MTNVEQFYVEWEGSAESFMERSSFRIYIFGKESKNHNLHYIDEYHKFF